MEIERKFLVRELPADLENFKHSEIIQAYISFSPTIRLRKADDKYFLTCKTKGNLAREEWEITISAEDFNRLWGKTEASAIEKTRYYIDISDGLVAELDIYHGFLSDLLTVEVEFDSVSDAESFQAPSWFGLDVTYDSRYKNSRLSQMTDSEIINLGIQKTL